MQAELLTRHVVVHSDAISEVAGADTSTIVLNKKKNNSMRKGHDAKKSSILRELTLKWFTGNQVCVKFVQYKTHSVFYII